MNWLLKLYTPEALTDLSQDLKAKGDFRAGAREKHWTAIGLCLLFSLGLAWWSAHVFGQWWSGPVAFVVGVGLTGYIQRRQAMRDNILYSVGDFTLGTVTSRFLLSDSGWKYTYTFKTPGDSPFRGKTSFVLSTEFPNRDMPKKGDPVWIFYDPGSPHRNNLYIPARFKKDCLSTTQYQRFMDQLKEQT